MERLTVILSPHFDDAVLSLGGLLAQKGASAKVVTFFTGKPRIPRVSLWDLVCGFSNSDKAVDARNKENTDALTYVGVPQNSIINLGYSEQQYRSAKDEIELNELLLKELLKFLNEYSDREIDLYAPSLEIHKDHHLIKKTLLAAIPHLNDRPITFFLYQDIPYAYSTPFLKLPKDHIKNYQIETVPISLSKENVDRKIAAVKLYSSQILPLAITSGGSLSARIKNFALKQACKFNISTSYCETVYKILVTP